jgi:hypothetical protein
VIISFHFVNQMQNTKEEIFLFEVFLIKHPGSQTGVHLYPTGDLGPGVQSAIMSNKPGHF